MRGVSAHRIRMAPGSNLERMETVDWGTLDTGLRGELPKTPFGQHYFLFFRIPPLGPSPKPHDPRFFKFQVCMGLPIQTRSVKILDLGGLGEGQGKNQTKTKNSVAQTVF